MNKISRRVVGAANPSLLGGHHHTNWPAQQHGTPTNAEPRVRLPGAGNWAGGPASSLPVTADPVQRGSDLEETHNVKTTDP